MSPNIIMIKNFMDKQNKNVGEETVNEVFNALTPAEKPYIVDTEIRTINYYPKEIDSVKKALKDLLDTLKDVMSIIQIVKLIIKLLRNKE